MKNWGANAPACSPPSGPGRHRESLLDYLKTTYGLDAGFERALFEQLGGQHETVRSAARAAMTVPVQHPVSLQPPAAGGRKW